MEPINVLEAKSRLELREWYLKNHLTEKECWVAVKRGQPKDNITFWYIDAVEESLCFGWIDGINKLINGVRMQRFTPRRKNSKWTELNKERARRMERLGQMTGAGKSVLPDMSPNSFTIEKDILEKLQADKIVWENFIGFPELYTRIRIDTIQYYKSDKELYQQRLEKFISNTRAGIMYGDWNDNGRLLT